ncbi:MAG TPA: LpxD N-terminal domain-containing protein, partial [Burkholderiales bacterium]|nr:LpxD N-terminal domain-containing protein [Burkholderiales bacterium]
MRRDRVMDESGRNSYTLGDIAGRYGGEVVGDPMIPIHQVATLENGGPGTLAFVTSSRYLPQLEATRASAVLIGTAMRDATALPRIVCDDPYAYFARVSALFNPPRAAIAGIHPTAAVDATARVADDAEIGAQAVVGHGACVGTGSIIGPACIVGEGASIGEGVRLHAKVTIYE